MVPLSNIPLSEVTVCIRLLWFVHITVSPWLIVVLVGENIISAIDTVVWLAANVWLGIIAKTTAKTKTGKTIKAAFNLISISPPLSKRKLNGLGACIFIKPHHRRLYYNDPTHS
jgi:hypothetical protein